CGATDSSEVADRERTGHVSPGVRSDVHIGGTEGFRASINRVTVGERAHVHGVVHVECHVVCGVANVTEDNRELRNTGSAAGLGNEHGVVTVHLLRGGGGDRSVTPGRPATWAGTRGSRFKA